MINTGGNGGSGGGKSNILSIFFDKLGWPSIIAILSVVCPIQYGNLVVIDVSA
jgi:hypothetical protein